MKIAVSYDVLQPQRGGAERMCQNLCLELIRKGHEVHIFALKWDEEIAQATYHKIAIPPWCIKGFGRRSAYARNAERLIKKIDAQVQFDSVLAFGKSMYMDVLRPGGGVHQAFLDREMKNASLTMRLKQWRPDKLWTVRTEKARFGPGGKHHIIAVSNLVKDEIVRYYNCEPERIHVIHNGAKLDKFTDDIRDRYRTATREELGLIDDEVAILFVGHGFERKGLGPLVKALPLLEGKGTPYRILIVGQGNQERYEQMARELGVLGRLKFLGRTSKIESFYAASDLFCFPSVYDPCANVVLEALACRLPVITSKTNGSGELLTDGLNGYVVDAHDSDAIAARIAEYFDPATRATAAQAARALAESRPFEKVAEEILAVLQKVGGCRKG
jgi:UDP-glucose:(heptosyl)LPS alpha-1,3-glucosyltransferase